MSFQKWLTATVITTIIFAAIVVCFNLYVDHHAIRSILFTFNKEFRQGDYPAGLNQHMFNAEYIFRNPDQFDSFLFGSSRVGVIDVSQVSQGRFYNMSYSLGQPAQHLAIIKAFLKKGIKIKSVLVGLDEICFYPVQSAEKNLIRIMHPEAGGPGRLEIFGTYFFRKPTQKELSLWKKRVLRGDRKSGMEISPQGVNLGWREQDQIMDRTGRPLFNYNVHKHEPMIFGPKDSRAVFAVIAELIALADEYDFSLTFFINPFYGPSYLNNAESLLAIKKELAKYTDYYDFSGFNSVSTDAMNYYDEGHYRYRVGDLIIDRIFGGGQVKAPEDFGTLVTRENIDRHIENQKRELERHLRNAPLP